MTREAVGTAGVTGGVVAAWARIARRRWRSGVVIFATLFALAAGVLFLTRPIYRVEAALRLGEPPPATGVSPTAGIFGLLTAGGDPFANDAELLASRTVTERVVEDVALAATVKAPRGWHRDSLFVSLTADRSTVKARYRAEWQADGTVRVTRTAPTDSLVGAVSPGERLSFGGLEVAFQPWRAGMPTSIEIRTVPFAEAVRVYRPKLRAERLRRDANVLGLRFDHTDPGVAERVVASAIDHFIALRADLHRRESGQAADSLRAVAQQTITELARAEAALEEHQRRARMVAPEAQGEAFTTRYVETLIELERARAELAAIDSALTRVSSDSLSVSALAELAGLPAFQGNASVTQLVNRLSGLEAERVGLLSRRTEASREYRVIEEQIAIATDALRKLAEGYRTAKAGEVELLEAQVSSIETELARLPGDAIGLTRLQRDVLMLSEVLVLTEQRLRQEEMRQALTYANVQVVDTPALRDRPIWPRKKLGLLVGFVVAAGFAGLGVLVRERADRSVRRASDLHATAGTPLLATVIRGPGGSPRLAPYSLEALLRRAAAGENGVRRLTLAGVDGNGEADEVARAIFDASVNGNGRGSPAGNGAGGTVTAGATANGGSDDEARRMPDIAVAPPIRDFPSAVAAASEGVPVTLVVVAGRTRLEHVERAVRQITEAGGRVAGAVVVCHREADAYELQS